MGSAKKKIIVIVFALFLACLSTREFHRGDDKKTESGIGVNKIINQEGTQTTGTLETTRDPKPTEKPKEVKGLPADTLWKEAQASGSPRSYLENYIKEGNDLNIPGAYGQVLIDLVIDQHDPKLIILLVENGADFMWHGPVGYTTVDRMFSFKENKDVYFDSPLLPVLLNNGLDANWINDRDESFLLLISKRNEISEFNLASAQELVKNGIDVSLKSRSGFTCFDYILFQLKKKIELLKVILNTKAESGTYSGEYLPARELIKYMKRPDTLVYSISRMMEQKENKELAFLLLERGFDGNIYAKDISLLYKLLENKNGYDSEFIRGLVQNGLDLNAPYHSHYFATIYRSLEKSKDESLFAFFLDHGYEVKVEHFEDLASDPWMNDKLQYMAIEGFLKRGYNFNRAYDSFFKTNALQKAVSTSRMDLLKLYETYGADYSTVNSKMQNLFHLAAVKGHPDVVSFLLSKAEYSDAKDKDGNTPLHTACLNGHFNMIKIFIAHGADIQSINNFGHSLLVTAAIKNHLKIFKYFLDSGQDPFIKIEENDTLLDLSLISGSEDVIRYILNYFPEMKSRFMKKDEISAILSRKSPAGFRWHYAAASSPIEGGGYAFFEDSTWNLNPYRKAEYGRWKIKGGKLYLYDLSGKLLYTLDWYEMKWPKKGLSWTTFKNTQWDIKQHKRLLGQ